MRPLVRAIEALTGATGAIAAWLVAFLTVAICWEVFSRYVLGAPTIWAFELGYMLMGTNFLIGAAYALRQSAHIRIDLFYARMPPRVKAAINLGGYLALLLPFTTWLAAALWTKTHVAIVSQERSGNSAWNPLIWPYRAVFCLAFALLALQLVAESIKAIRTLTGRDAPAPRA